VKIYCEHGRVFGVVELNPVGGFPELRVRTPRWRDRHAAALGHPDDRDNVHWRLAELIHPTYEAEGCRDCGPRQLPVRDLLAAFEAGRSKYVLTVVLQ
jgi:hypothetical protein